MEIITIISGVVSQIRILEINLTQILVIVGLKRMLQMIKMKENVLHVIKKVIGHQIVHKKIKVQ